MDRRSGPGRVVLKVVMGRAEADSSREKMMGRDGPAQPWAGPPAPTHMLRPTDGVFVLLLRTPLGTHTNKH